MGSTPYDIAGLENVPGVFRVWREPYDITDNGENFSCLTYYAGLPGAPVPVTCAGPGAKPPDHTLHPLQATTDPSAAYGGTPAAGTLVSDIDPVPDYAMVYVHILEPITAGYYTACNIPEEAAIWPDGCRGLVNPQPDAAVEALTTAFLKTRDMAEGSLDGYLTAGGWSGDPGNPYAAYVIPFSAVEAITVEWQSIIDEEDTELGWHRVRSNPDVYPGLQWNDELRVLCYRVDDDDPPPPAPAGDWMCVL